MAKQAGDIFIEGTIDDLTYYKMYGKYYVRMKSSLTGKRFRKDKAFEGSRKSALLLGRASKIASLFYRNYPKEKKARGLFNEMTGRVRQWLKEDKGKEDVLLLLLHNYTDQTKEPVSYQNKRICKKRVVPRWRNDRLIVIAEKTIRRPLHFGRIRARLPSKPIDDFYLSLSRD